MPKVERDISVRPVDPANAHALWAFINRELVPFVRAIRAALNAMTYQAEFTSADVVGGGIFVHHNLDAGIVHVTLRDGDIPARLRPPATLEVTVVDDNQIRIDVSALSITGTWQVLVSRG